ncbi:IS3 family transposase, partial [Thiotrichales bacterium 19X7-9]|nr:IS3 family transposase [Thiotrichales bacterium 19X7-9]
MREANWEVQLTYSPLCKPKQVKYAFIANNSEYFPVLVMCKVFKVSKSAYYRWLINPISKRDLRNHELDDEVYAIFYKHKRRYGAKRIYQEMKDKGWKVTENKVLERMKLMNLIAKANKKFIKTTDTQHNKYVAANRLKQDFKAEKPNEKYVTDITYIPTAEGFLYLCVFLDLYSRAIVGWSMADHMRSELVINGLTMAMFKRGMPSNVLIHSDKG